MMVLKMPMDPMCSMYGVDFLDLAERCGAVAGEKISSVVNTLLAGTPYNVPRSCGGANPG